MMGWERGGGLEQGVQLREIFSFAMVEDCVCCVVVMNDFSSQWWGKETMCEMMFGGGGCCGVCN